MKENVKSVSQKLTFYNDSLLSGYCTDIRVKAFTTSQGLIIETDVLYTGKPDGCQYELRWHNGSLIVLNNNGPYRTVYIVTNNYSLVTGQDIKDKK
jgi:hypothetical protein